MRRKHYISLLCIIICINNLAIAAPGKGFLKNIFGKKGSTSTTNYAAHSDDEAEPSAKNQSPDHSSYQEYDPSYYTNYQTSYQEGDSSYYTYNQSQYEGEEPSYYTNYKTPYQEGEASYYANHETPYQTYNQTYYSSGYESGYPSYQHSSWPGYEEPSNNSYSGYYQQNEETSSHYDCTCGVLEHRRSRIYQGDFASHLEFPWLGKLHIYYYQNEQLLYRLCGAAMITRSRFLSAAHCFAPGYEYIKAFLSDDQEHMVRSVDIHESYYHHKNYDKNDVAVGILNEAVTFGNPITPICLPIKNEDFDGEISTTAGWGSINDNRDLSDGLLKVDLPILTKEQCSQSSHFYPIADNAFCAGYLEGGPASCKGDSGSPVMVKGRNDEMIVAGTNSYSEGCGKPGFPGVKMKISKFVKWIKSKLGDELLCPRPY